MVKLICLMLFVFSLSSCALFTKEKIIYKIKIKEVPIEVLKCPTIDVKIRPRLAIQDINENSNISKTFAAYPISILQLKDYTLYLENLIIQNNEF